jgi:hypothetical protein
VAASHLFDYLFEVGPTSSGAMGPIPLEWPALESWARCVPRGIQPWEFLMLRRLSIAWCAEAERARDSDAIAPYAEVTVEQKVAVGSRLRDTLRAWGTRK